MDKKIFCIFLLQVYISKAYLQDNAGSSQLVENRVNNVLDCNANNLPDQKQVRLNPGALVLQPQDNSRTNVPNNHVLQSVQTKRPYVYDHDAVDNLENKDNPTLDVVNPENDLSNIDPRRKETPELQNDYLKNTNLSDPTLLGKLVEKCLTKRLLLAQRARQLNPEDLLNSRRSNSQDSVEGEDLSLEDPKNLNVDEELVDPAEAEGLRRLNRLDKDVSLMRHKRVCYACTSASGVNCWIPNRLTTVKYCKSEHDSCTTKTYQAGTQLVVVRDCGNTCASTIGIDPVYKSCSICQSDLCNTSNGAHSVTSHGLILCLFVISFAKAIF